jgi:hypothetical protein
MVAQGRYRLAVTRGQADHLTDPRPVITHLRDRIDQGMSIAAIAAVSHVPDPTIETILYHRPLVGVRASTARRLTAVRCTHVGVAPELMVPACGSQRRLRALHAVGWSMSAIARDAGVPRCSLSQTLRRPRITAGRATVIAGVYQRLAMTPGPSEATRARALAAGWPPPLAWDDDTIDDPDTVPSGVRGVEHRRDPVDRVDRIELRVEALERWEGIARDLGVTVEAVRRCLQRQDRGDLIERLDRREPARDAA